MHELSIAQSLVELLSEQAHAAGAARVTAADIEVGVLSGVVPAALRSAFGPVSRQTLVEGATLRIHEVNVRGLCAGCNAQRDAVSVQRLHCIECDRPLAEITRGRELDVISIEVVDEAQNT